MHFTRQSSWLSKTITHCCWSTHWCACTAHVLGAMLSLSLSTTIPVSLSFCIVQSSVYPGLIPTPHLQAAGLGMRTCITPLDIMIITASPLPPTLIPTDHSLLDLEHVTHSFSSPFPLPPPILLLSSSSSLSSCPLSPTPSSFPLLPFLLPTCRPGYISYNPPVTQKKHYSF